MDNFRNYPLRTILHILHYIKEKDNLQAILEAIDQLKQIRSDYISTERIQFICEQSNGHPSSMEEKDEITRQAESNLEAYQEMFYVHKGVVSYEPTSQINRDV